MVKKLTRREREKQRHRQEILSAAREVFAEKGYSRASMAKIAEKSEFAVGTLYKFFKDKQSLYKALVLDTVQEVTRVLLDALEQPGTEVEKLERYIEEKAKLMFQHISIGRLYFSQTAGSKLMATAGFDDEVNEIYGRAQKKLESVFRNGIRKKVFAKVNPRMLVLGIEGVSNAFLQELFSNPREFTPEILADLTKKIFFDRVRLKMA